MMLKSLNVVALSFNHISSYAKIAAFLFLFGKLNGIICALFLFTVSKRVAIPFLIMYIASISASVVIAIKAFSHEESMKNG